jgi:hypothetical protein
VEVLQPFQPVAVEHATGRGEGIRPAQHAGQQFVVTRGGRHATQGGPRRFAATYQRVVRGSGSDPHHEQDGERQGVECDVHRDDQRQAARDHIGGRQSEAQQKDGGKRQQGSPGHVRYAEQHG